MSGYITVYNSGLSDSPDADADGMLDAYMMTEMSAAFVNEPEFDLDCRLTYDIPRQEI